MNDVCNANAHPFIVLFCNLQVFGKVQLCHVIWIAGRYSHKTSSAGYWNVDGSRKDPTKWANQGGLSYDTSDLHLSQRHGLDGTTEPGGKFLETNPPEYTLKPRVYQDRFLYVYNFFTKKEKKSLYSIFHGETCVVFISLGPFLSHSPHLSKILRDMFVRATPCFLWDHWSERHGDGGCICGWHRKVNSFPAPENWWLEDENSESGIRDTYFQGQTCFVWF